MDCRPVASGLLAPYYLLYKFYANRGELPEAQEDATKALAAAALQASIDPDWCEVQPGDTDFTIPGPARIWLFTLRHWRQSAYGAAIALLH